MVKKAPSKVRARSIVSKCPECGIAAGHKIDCPRGGIRGARFLAKVEAVGDPGGSVLAAPIPDELIEALKAAAVEREARASVALDKDPEGMTVSGSFGPAAELAARAREEADDLTQPAPEQYRRILAQWDEARAKARGVLEQAASAKYWFERAERVWHRMTPEEQAAFENCPHTNQTHGRCDECGKTSLDIAAAEARASESRLEPDEVICIACQKPAYAEQTITLGGGGPFCVPCAERVDAEMEKPGLGAGDPLVERRPFSDGGMHVYVALARDWHERALKLAQRKGQSVEQFVEQLIRRQWTASGGGRF